MTTLLKIGTALTYISSYDCNGEPLPDEPDVIVIDSLPDTSTGFDGRSYRIVLLAEGASDEEIVSRIGADAAAIQPRRPSIQPS